MDREIMQTPLSGLEKIKVNFFETSPSTNPTVKRVAEFISEDNKSKNFVEKLIKFDGVAVWDKALLGTAPQTGSSSIVKTTNSSTIKINNGSASHDTVMYIPLVPQSGKSVYSFIKATVNGANIKWRLYSGRDYDKYQHGTLNDNKVNAEKLAAITMLLDYEVFGYTKFVIRDKGLFKGGKNASKPWRILLTPSNSNIATGSNSTISIKANGYYWVSHCFTYEYESCPYDPCQGPGGTCDRCSNCMTATTSCVEKMIFLPEGGGGGGGTVDNPPPGGGGGGGGDGIPGNGDTPDDACEIDSPCGRLGWTSDQALAINLRPKLGISLSEYSNFLTWVTENPTHAVEILDFLDQTTYSDLTASEKTEIAILHYDNLKNDPEYKAMVEDFSAEAMVLHPWMIELLKELSVEVGVKVAKKHMPGYSDWQSILNAISQASHGDFIGSIGEVINIVKKKVPGLNVLVAAWDAIDFAKLAKKSWAAFSRIKRITPDAFSGIVTTVKNRCGGLIDKLEHDAVSGQGVIKYGTNPTDAANFFLEIASHIPNTPVNHTSNGSMYFDVSGIRFTYYPAASSNGVPTISLSSLTTNWQYKFRFQ